MKTKNICLIIIIIVSLTAWGFFSFFDLSITSTKIETNSIADGGNYSLINKAVTANIGKHFIVNFAPLKIQFENIIKKYSQKTYVYFSYINNGSWIGINEKEEFTAASTIKVPLAMSVYKLSEINKLDLGGSYAVEEADLDSNFGDLYKTGLGKTFTIDDLTEIMLEKSDNTAMNAIYNVLLRLGIQDPLNKVYEELGWQFLTPPTLDEVPDYQKINLKTLANMFLALYNSTFLNPENSQQVLKALSETSFDDKIVSGVPENITVSHKIGISTPDDTFSNCGIIYVPSRNYLLCVGSSGANEETANKFMSEISKATYEYVIKN